MYNFNRSVFPKLKAYKSGETLQPEQINIQRKGAHDLNMFSRRSRIRALTLFERVGVRNSLVVTEVRNLQPVTNRKRKAQTQQNGRKSYFFKPAVWHFRFDLTHWLVAEKNPDKILQFSLFCTKFCYFCANRLFSTFVFIALPGCRQKKSRTQIHFLSDSALKW